MKIREQGFTLIELVVTISIIAILAAVALPRYIALQTQARTAKMQAIYGGVRSAAMLAHAQAIASNTTAAATVPMEGANITQINAYPTADAAGIITALQLDTTGDQVTISAGGAAAGSTITIHINGATKAGDSRLLYTSPPAQPAPVIAPPLPARCSLR